MKQSTARRPFISLMLSAIMLAGITSALPSAFAASHAGDHPATLPAGFVYVDSLIPNIDQHLRYNTTDNFVGQRIDGYRSNRAILSEAAARRLAAAQKTLNRFGLGLHIFDAYRPQRAVDHFVRWAKDLQDTRNKADYYPDVAKKDLFKDGYIASKSGHTRGSTVDLTLINLKDGKPLDMGSGFDFFGKQSWPDYPHLTAQQRANRLLLRSIMERHGFVPLPQEWWHFTLKNEPFPETYFNFPVE